MSPPDHPEWRATEASTKTFAAVDQLLQLFIRRYSKLRGEPLGAT